MAKKEKKVTNKENNKDNKNKKSFFKALKAELKKVIWPTPKQLVNNTIAVITIVLITAIIVFVLDLAFKTLNKYGIDNIKESIQSTQATENNSNTTENAEKEEQSTTDDENATDEATDTETTEKVDEDSNSIE